MKKTILAIALALMAFNPIFGQTTSDSEDSDSTGKIPFADRKITFYLGGFDDVHEGLGGNLGLNFNDIQDVPPILSNIYLGLIFTSAVPIGAEFGVNRLKKSWKDGKIKYSEKIGFGFYYKNNIFIAHDSLIATSLKGPSNKMIVTVQLGPRLEFANRVVVFASLNPGVSWYPNKVLKSKTNAFWYFGFNAGLALRFGGKKKES